jgi:hypothetical protein
VLFGLASGAKLCAALSASVVSMLILYNYINYPEFLYASF